MVKNARKFYTARASLCALGCYLRQQQMFKVLPFVKTKNEVFYGACFNEP
jgi:hypothetical protein